MSCNGNADNNGLLAGLKASSMRQSVTLLSPLRVDVLNHLAYIYEDLHS